MIFTVNVTTSSSSACRTRQITLQADNARQAVQAAFPRDTFAFVLPPSPADLALGFRNDPERGRVLVYGHVVPVGPAPRA